MKPLTALAAIASVLCILASCLPFQNDAASVREDGKEEALALFSMITALEFMERLRNTEGTWNGSTVSLRAEIGEYDGHIDLSFTGEKSGNTLHARRYLMNGDAGKVETEIRIEDAGGSAENLTFSLSGTEASLASAAARLCYPDSGTIIIDGTASSPLDLFPEDPPSAAEELSEEETEMLHLLAEEAFSLFSSAGTETETKSFMYGTATLIPDDDGWTMRILAEADGKAISMTIPQDGIISAVIGEKSVVTEYSVIMEGITVPPSAEIHEALEWIEALCRSNLLYAAGSLLNGSESGVIALEEFSAMPEAGSAVFHLTLDNYGMGSGKSASGELVLTLYGNMSDGELAAERYMMESVGLTFSGYDGPVVLENVEGRVEGNGTPPVLTAGNGGEWKAEFTFSSHLSVPESGGISCGGETLEL